jgi:hypothetical protein
MERVSQPPPLPPTLPLEQSVVSASARRGGLEQTAQYSHSASTAPRASVVSAAVLTGTVSLQTRHRTARTLSEASAHARHNTWAGPAKQSFLRQLRSVAVRRCALGTESASCPLLNLVWRAAEASASANQDIAEKFATKRRSAHGTGAAATASATWNKTRASARPASVEGTAGNHSAARRTRESPSARGRGNATRPRTAANATGATLAHPATRSIYARGANAEDMELATISCRSAIVLRVSRARSANALSAGQQAPALVMASATLNWRSASVILDTPAPTVRRSSGARLTLALATASATSRLRNAAATRALPARRALCRSAARLATALATAPATPRRVPANASLATVARAARSRLLAAPVAPPMVRAVILTDFTVRGTAAVLGSTSASQSASAMDLTRVTPAARRSAAQRAFMDHATTKLGAARATRGTLERTVRRSCARMTATHRSVKGSASMGAAQLLLTVNARLLTDGVASTAVRSDALRTVAGTVNATQQA